MGRVVGVLVGQSWEEGMALGKEAEVAVGDREAVGPGGSIACCVLKQREVGRVKERVGGWEVGSAAVRVLVKWVGRMQEEVERVQEVEAKEVVVDLEVVGHEAAGS